MSFRAIHQTEVDDYMSSIKALGFDSDDFALTEHSTEDSASAVPAVTGTVAVLRRSTEKSRLYATGHGSSWPAEFHDDLLQGKFGRA